MIPTKQLNALAVAMSLAFCMGYWYQGYSIYKGLIGGYADMMPKVDKK